MILHICSKLEICAKLKMRLILMLFFVYIICLRGNKSNKEVQYFTGFRYAHRGLHKKPCLPENSLAAFAAATERGYGIELDVHLMADGELAVIHDSSLKRTVGTDVCIEKITRQDLEKYTLEESNERIPTLKEVLSLVDGKVPLLIELKAEKNVEALCTATVAELENYNGKYCIESFDPRCIAWLRKNAPGIVRGQLSSNFFEDKSVPLSGALKLVLTSLVLNVWTRPDFVAFKFEDRRLISNRIATRLWKTQSFVWTIRDERDFYIAEKEGLCSIFEGFEP